jgi:hypothetical protein
VDTFVVPSRAGGVELVKKPRGRPSTVSSSRGGVLIRTASWLEVRLELSMKSNSATYVSGILTVEGLEAPYALRISIQLVQDLHLTHRCVFSPTLESQEAYYP